MKYEFGNDPAKIEGYRKFWGLEKVKRPLVGFSFKSWFPLDEFRASSAWPKGEKLTPDMVVPMDFMDDQEKLLREGEVIEDDILRGASPSQAIFWGDGTLGSEMRVLPGNVVAEERRLSWDEIENIEIDWNAPWFRKYMEWVEALVARSAGRYPVSHATPVGPFDYVVTLRGHEQSVVDLMLDPEPVERLLDRMGDFFIELMKAPWRKIPLFHGGYYDAQYNIWAPKSIVRMQEDAVAVLSPDLYRRYLAKVDRRVAAAFECSFIHLHATSMIVLDQMLEIPEIRCYEINNDVGGPPVATMVPYFQMVQKAKKPLVIRGSFSPDELRMLMDSLAPEGLYLYIMVSDGKEIDALRPIVGM